MWQIYVEFLSDFESGLFDLNHVDLNHDLNRDLNHLIFFKKITDLNQLL